MNKDNLLSGPFLRGSGDTFIQIYEKYWQRLFLSCYRRIRNKKDAEEIVQDLFVKLLQKRMALNVRELENYLFVAIKNATIDYFKRQATSEKYLEHRRALGEATANSTDEMVALRDLEEQLEQGLRKLSGKSETVFRLYRMDNWPVARIAAHLNLSEKAINYHLTRSQKFIRAYLQEFTLIFSVFHLF